MFKLAVFAVLGLAAAQVPEGAYPSLTPAQIEEEYPKIANEYIVVFKAQQPEALVATHMDSIKAHATTTLHREYHIAAADTSITAVTTFLYRSTVEGEEPNSLPSTAPFFLSMPSEHW